jgi:hypothetical protein
MFGLFDAAADWTARMLGGEREQDEEPAGDGHASGMLIGPATRD